MSVRIDWSESFLLDQVKNISGDEYLFRIKHDDTLDIKGQKRADIFDKMSAINRDVSFRVKDALGNCTDDAAIFEFVTKLRIYSGAREKFSFNATYCPPVSGKDRGIPSLENEIVKTEKVFSLSFGTIKLEISAPSSITAENLSFLRGFLDQKVSELSQKETIFATFSENIKALKELEIIRKDLGVEVEVQQLTTANVERETKELREEGAKVAASKVAVSVAKPKLKKEKTSSSENEPSNDPLAMAIYLVPPERLQVLRSIPVNTVHEHFDPKMDYLSLGRSEKVRIFRKKSTINLLWTDGSVKKYAFRVYCFNPNGIDSVQNRILEQVVEFVKGMLPLIKDAATEKQAIARMEAYNKMCTSTSKVITFSKVPTRI